MDYYNIYYKNGKVNKHPMTHSDLVILGQRNGVVVGNKRIPNNKLRVVKVTVL